MSRNYFGRAFGPDRARSREASCGLFSFGSAKSKPYTSCYCRAEPNIINLEIAKVNMNRCLPNLISKFDLYIGPFPCQCQTQSVLFGSVRHGSGTTYSYASQGRHGLVSISS